MHISTALLAASIFMAPFSARAEELHSYFHAAEDGSSGTLTISPCTGEEVSECVSQTLQCTARVWPRLQFTLITGPIEKVARTMILGTDGQPRGSVKLAGGVSIDLQFSTVHLDANELDGGWTLTAGISDAAPLLDVITAKNGEGAVIALGGETFQLAPERGDGAKLVQLRDACLKLN
ncbi:hypothetical protein ACHMW7_07705 [Aminobacter sp. UC22_36]|uniref:hypothetical protein n=1 Tax=Aminobacter sp. UC22_36 TaxID=3374549 RepID=UPI003756ED3F